MSEPYVFPLIKGAINHACLTYTVQFESPDDQSKFHAAIGEDKDLKSINKDNISLVYEPNFKSWLDNNIKYKWTVNFIGQEIIFTDEQDAAWYLLKWGDYFD